MTELKWDNGLDHSHVENEKWYVNYTITLYKHPLLCQAGPYKFSEVDIQYNDIVSYQAIDDCYTTTIKDETRYNSSTQPMVSP